MMIKLENGEELTPYQVVSRVTAGELEKLLFYDEGPFTVDEIASMTEGYSELASYLEDMKLVDHYGGEGQGDNYYTIWEFPKLEIFVKFYGWYRSHYGTEYQGSTEVKPREKTITVYDNV